MSELTQTSAPVVPGHRVHGIIGQGAAAVVWAGTDQTGRPVAIKVPRQAADAAALAQGDAERQVLMAARHDHLVSLRDVVTLDDGRAALVFDQVTGTTLRAMVRVRGHLRPGEAVTVLTPVCSAVAALHGVGATHGDLSPANVMVTADGRPMVLDLGAARVAGSAAAVHGTPGFTAPEVRAGAVPGEAADVFALGAIAWFCLTGNGAPDTDIRLDAETIRSHVGRELADVVAACIDPDPSVRPSAAALATMIYDAAPAEPIEVVVGGDEASALTHRLRADAAADDPADESGPSLVARAATQARALLPRSPRRDGRRPDGLATLLRGPAGLAAGLVSAVALLWAVSAWFGEADPPVSARTAVAAHTVPGASTQPTPSPDGAPGPTGALGPTGAPGPTGGPGPTGAPAEASMKILRDAAAPRTQTAALMQALSNARARALVASDARLLSDVHEARSASWRTDADLIASLAAAGTRYVGLRLEVAEATFVSGTSAAATVRARVDWTDYVVVNEAGARDSRPAAAGDVLDFSLVRGSAGWRIRAVSPAPAT